MTDGKCPQSPPACWVQKASTAAPASPATSSCCLRTFTLCNSEDGTGMPCCLCGLSVFCGESLESLWLDFDALHFQHFHAGGEHLGAVVVVELAREGFNKLGGAVVEAEGSAGHLAHFFFRRRRRFHAAQDLRGHLNGPAL